MPAGRPLLHGERLDRAVQFQVSAKMKKRIEREARRRKVTVGECLRQIVCGHF